MNMNLTENDQNDLQLIKIYLIVNSKCSQFERNEEKKKKRKEIRDKNQYQHNKEMPLKPLEKDIVR